jgi:GTP-binding protein
MQIKKASFVKSSVSYKDCPQQLLPEYAFIGRSNVGKSSLINMLTGYGKLAKISSTPGKTQTINQFLINDDWFLADLPGFGYARVPLGIKKKWQKMILDYLEKRENLVYTFLLIDIRHEPLSNDLAFLNWFGNKQLPFYIVFTKADKLSKTKLEANLDVYLKRLSLTWDPLPSYVVSSSVKGLGREEILKVIAAGNQWFLRETEQ